MLGLQTFRKQTCQGQTFLMQRLKYGSANFSHEDALRLATQGGASLLHRKDIGQIRPGLQADLALFNLDELRFSGAGDPVAALVLCGAHRADAVIVNGDWRVRGGELVDIDIEEVMFQQRQAAKTLTS